MGISCVLIVILILSLNFSSSFSASFTLNPDGDIVSQSSESYDFIIVGAGVGGSVVARRLAEYTNTTFKYRILLLEAGPEDQEASDSCSVPGNQTKCLDNRKITFNYNYTTPNGTEEVALGKTLGGTGAISNMIFNRGSPYDFDNWANYTNDPTWSYKSLLKTFIKTEDYNGDFPYSPFIHGKNGPMHLTSRSVKPGSDYWLAAGQSLGLPHIDPSGPQNVSVNEPVFMKIYGRRQNVYDAYVKYGGYFPNLIVKTGAVVRNIIFDANKRATGVVYVKNGTRCTASASKEVILTSGAVGNVIVLWKSGIGPCDKLKESKVKCVSNRPVGSNLQDHVHVQLNFTLKDPSGSHGPNIPNTQQALDQLLVNGKGLFDSTQGQLGQFFIASRAAISAGFPDYPDLTGLVSRQFYGIHQNSILPSDEQTINITTFIFVGRPKSTGFIDPRSANGPLINPKYFSDEKGHDKRILIEGIRTMRRIFEEAKIYQKFSAKLQTPTNLSECDKFEFQSNKYWGCFIKNRALSSGEFAGTCKMGRVGDPTAVVDSKLRVIGVKNLRILDASIQPTIVNTNLIASTLMIAEKGAEDILRDNLY